VTLTLIFDVLIVALLALTIAYAIQLSARLAALRKDRAELEAMAMRFAQAAERAENAIAALKATSETAGKALEQVTAKAQGLRDDLSFMVERGEPLADRLTSIVTASLRQSPPREAAASAAASRVAAHTPMPASAPADAPRELLRRALANLR